MGWGGRAHLRFFPCMVRSSNIQTHKLLQGNGITKDKMKYEQRLRQWTDTQTDKKYSNLVNALGTMLSRTNRHQGWH